MNRYDNLDGMRVISCLGIIAMHVQANASYNITGEIWNTFIPSLTHLVPLFLILSGFGMFCGYYEKVKNKNVDWNQFFAKRYRRILPFFTLLILIDLVMERTITSLIEGVTEITLVFGLLPNNNLSVIGVSWTLGVIFLFYMLFPFFVYCCWTKRRAWIVLAASCLLNVLCSQYFFNDSFVVNNFVPRHSFIYCAPFFLGGGCVYLNREAIKHFVLRYRWLCWSVGICLTVLWYFIPLEIAGINILMLKNLILFLLWICYYISVDSKIFCNKVMKYLSQISLEMYLAQMVIFRIIEKTDCLYLWGKGWISYITVLIMVIAGLIIFIEIYRLSIKLITNKLLSYKEHKNEKE